MLFPHYKSIHVAVLYLSISPLFPMQNSVPVTSHRLQRAHEASPASTERLAGSEPADIVESGGASAKTKKVDKAVEFTEKTNIESIYTEWRDTPGRMAWEKSFIDLEVTAFELNAEYQRYLFEHDFSRLKTLLLERGLKVLDDEDGEGKMIAENIEKELRLKDDGQSKASKKYPGSRRTSRKDFRAYFFEEKVKSKFDDGYVSDDESEYPEDYGKGNKYEVAEMIQPQVAFRYYVEREHPAIIASSSAADERLVATAAAEGAALTEGSSIRIDRIDPLSRLLHMSCPQSTVHESMLALTHYEVHEVYPDSTGRNRWFIKPDMLEEDPEPFFDASSKAGDSKFRLLDKFSVRDTFLSGFPLYGEHGQNLNHALFGSSCLFPFSALPRPYFENDSDQRAGLQTHGCRARVKTRPEDLENQGETRLHLDGSQGRLLITTQGPATIFLQPGTRFYLMDIDALIHFFPLGRREGWVRKSSNNAHATSVLQKSELRRVLFEENISIFVVEPFAFTVAHDYVVAEDDSETDVSGSGGALSPDRTKYEDVIRFASRTVFSWLWLWWLIIKIDI